MSISDADVLFAGQLRHYDGARSRRERWTVLTPAMLKMYKTQADFEAGASPDETMRFEDLSERSFWLGDIEQQKRKNKPKFKFVLRVGPSDFVFAAKEEAEAERWINSLNDALMRREAKDNGHLFARPLQKEREEHEKTKAELRRLQEVMARIDADGGDAATALQKCRDALAESEQLAEERAQEVRDLRAHGEKQQEVLDSLVRELQVKTNTAERLRKALVSTTHKHKSLLQEHEALLQQCSGGSDRTGSELPSSKPGMLRSKSAMPATTATPLAADPGATVTNSVAFFEQLAKKAGAEMRAMRTKELTKSKKPERKRVIKTFKGNRIRDLLQQFEADDDKDNSNSATGDDGIGDNTQPFDSDDDDDSPC
ncbi:MAG: hypothetical protein MHM6MM_008261 [Cercozoa sp. M6MM]